MTIEKARRTDAKKLTELTIRSKNYWNYGVEQITKWKKELTIYPKYIDKNQTYKLLVNKKIIGFYAYKSKSIKTVKLDFLFIEPKFIGKGYGKLLLNDFLQRIKKTGCKEIIVNADPNAEKFYSKNGFEVVDKLESSIKNRFLPIMKLEIQF